VARRYDVHANQVFKWLKEPRFAGSSPLDEDDGPAIGPVFLPVEIIGEASEEVETREPASCTSCHRLEIDLAGGHRLRVIGAYDAEALAGLIRGLST
jgi:transposase